MIRNHAKGSTLSEIPNGGPTPAARPGRRALFQRVLEVAISLVFLALAVRGIDLRALWAALKEAEYLWLLPFVAMTALLLLLKGWRWQLLFRPEYRLPFSSVFTALCAGYLANNVLPARAGELARLVLLVSEQPVSAARTLSTIVVERLLDVLTLLLVTVALLPFVRLPGWMTRSAQLLGLAALAASAAIVVLSFWKDRLLRWAKALLHHIRFLDRPGVYASLGHLIDGFVVLRSRRGVGLVGLSLLAWVGIVAETWAAAQALRLEIPVTAVALAVVVTSLGMLVPSSPGYVGIFHYLVTVALAPFGVPKDLALSFALVWHAANYLSLSAAGVITLWAHGTSFAQVRQRWRQRREAASG